MVGIDWALSCSRKNPGRPPGRLASAVAMMVNRTVMMRKLRIPEIQPMRAPLRTESDWPVRRLNR